MPSSRGILPTQGSNLGLPHCRRILYRLGHQESIPEFCRLAKYAALTWGATSAPSRGRARGQAKEGEGTCASTASPSSRGLPRLNLVSHRRGLLPPLVPRRRWTSSLALRPRPRGPGPGPSPRGGPTSPPGTLGDVVFGSSWQERVAGWPPALTRVRGCQVRDPDPRCGPAQEGPRGRAVGWLQRRRFGGLVRRGALDEPRGICNSQSCRISRESVLNEPVPIPGTVTGGAESPKASSLEKPVDPGPDAPPPPHTTRRSRSRDYSHRCPGWSLRPPSPIPPRFPSWPLATHKDSTSTRKYLILFPNILIILFTN